MALEKSFLRFDIDSFGEEDTDILYANPKAAKEERDKRFDHLTRENGPYHFALAFASAGIWFGMGYGIYSLIQYLK